MLETNAMIGKLDAAGIDQVVLIPAMNDPLPADTPQMLLTVLRKIMCSPLRDLLPVIDPLFYTADGNLKLRGDVYNIYARPDNAAVAEVVSRHPDRLRWWVFVNPGAVGDPRAELERWKDSPGVMGVKLHPFWHRYSLTDAIGIAESCEELELPMLIHLGFGERGAWQRIADRCPKLRLVFAHCGMPYFDRLWRAAAAYPNVLLDVSSPYLDEKLVRRAVATLGPQRMLYGTDAPYGFHGPDHSYDYTHIKAWVERLPCSARNIERILGTNALELFAR
jgi:predicted TIM-barrel fold metal-dependent hydrolase